MDTKTIIWIIVFAFLYYLVASLIIWGGYELYSYQKDKSKECPDSGNASAWKQFRIERDMFNFLGRDYTIYDVKNSGTVLARVTSTFPSRFEIAPAPSAPNLVKMTFNRQFLAEFANVLQPCYKVVIKDADTAPSSAKCDALPSRIDGEWSLNKEYTLVLNGVKYTATQDYNSTLFTVKITKEGNLIAQANLSPGDTMNRNWYLCVSADATVEEQELFIATIVTYDSQYTDQSKDKNNKNSGGSNWGTDSGISLMVLGVFLMLIPPIGILYTKFMES